MRLSETLWSDFAPGIQRVNVLLVLIEVYPPNALFEVEHDAKSLDRRVGIRVDLDRGLCALPIDEDWKKQAHLVAIPDCTPVGRALKCLVGGEQIAHQGPDIPRHD